MDLGLFGDAVQVARHGLAVQRDSAFVETGQLSSVPEGVTVDLRHHQFRLNQLEMSRMSTEVILFVFRLRIFSFFLVLLTFVTVDLK